MLDVNRLNRANGRLDALLDRLRPAFLPEHRLDVDSAREALNRAAEKLAATDVEWAEQALETARSIMDKLGRKAPLYYPSVEGL